MGETIGLFGGSFNPIHFGHLLAARAILEQLPLQRVVFLPSRRPPHKSEGDLVAAEHRAEMVRLAIADELGFVFSDHDVARSGPCYTFDTVRHFRSSLGDDVDLCWIIGADSLPELPQWHRAADLIDSCRIITVSRPGIKIVDWSALYRHFGEDRVGKLREGVIPTPTIDISATDIRRRIVEGRSIRFLVPEPVRDYIDTNRVYSEQP